MIFSLFHLFTRQKTLKLMPSPLFINYLLKIIFSLFFLLHNFLNIFVILFLSVKKKGEKLMSLIRNNATFES